MANESIKDGPAPGREASPAEAVPTVAKIPAPMMAPMPNRVMLMGPSERLSLWPSSCVAARRSSRFFVRKFLGSQLCLPNFVLDDQLPVVANNRAECMVYGLTVHTFGFA